MTDDPEPEDALAGLAKAQAGAQRSLKRNIVLGAGMLGTLGLLDFALVLLGRGPFVWRDAGVVFGLTFVGAGAWWQSWLIHRRMIDLDSDVLTGLRRQAEMMESINGVRPLLAAIEEAHAQGAALVVEPPDAPDTPHHVLH